MSDISVLSKLLIYKNLHCINGIIMNTFDGKAVFFALFRLVLKNSENISWNFP